MSFINQFNDVEKTDNMNNRDFPLKKRVIILGLAPQGLALLRMYYRAGYNVIGIGLPGQLGLLSSCGKTIVVEPVKKLEELLRRYAFKGTVVHVTSDIFLNYLLNEYPEAYNMYEILPSKNVAEVFTDKIKTQALAHRLGIPTPTTYKGDVIDPKSFRIFPSILKWNRRYRKTKFKTIILNSSSEMDDIFKGLSPEDKSNLIVQEYLIGLPGDDVSYGGYWEGGCEKIGMSFVQKRKFPIYGGLASCVVEDHSDVGVEVRRLALKILEQMHYSGFVEVECRINRSDGRIYLIEINPRACGWIKVLMKKFQEELLLNVKYTSDKLMIWINLLRDLRAIMDLIKKGFYKLAVNALTDYVHSPVFDILDLEDLRPFLLQIAKLKL